LSFAMPAGEAQQSIPEKWRDPKKARCLT